MVVSSKDGRLKELDVNTEWKKLLKREAFPLSEVAEEESNVTVDGMKIIYYTFIRHRAT